MPQSGDSSRPTTTALERVPAATRFAGGVDYVCPVGWSSEVFCLEGAAGAVWAAFADHRSVHDVAAALGVTPVDPFLLEAIAMMSEAGLLVSPAGSVAR